MADLLKKDELEAHTLLTVKEVREVFGIARSTVYRWIDRCWLRKAGQVQAPQDYKNQKIVLLELADEDLQEQFEGWVRAERTAGKNPRFFVEDLARVEPLPAEETDPRLESKRLVGELGDLMGRLDKEVEERNQLVEDLDSAPAIEPSGLKQAEKGLSEIVDLLKEISDREGDLREETAELPDKLELPPHASESEEFTRELGEERGTGLEPENRRLDADDLDQDEVDQGEVDQGEVDQDDLDQDDLPIEEFDIDDPGEEAVAQEVEEREAPEEDSIQAMIEEELGEFAFLADPETLNEDGEWIELNIDEIENPLLKEELLALDERFLPGAKRRGVEIDFNKGLLSETELDELSAAEESIETDGELTQGVDEENDSWLGISLASEEVGPGDMADDPYDPTGDFLEGDELHHLQAMVDDGDAEGFYLDGEALVAKSREEDDQEAPQGDTDLPEKARAETTHKEEVESELLDMDLLPADEGWAAGADETFSVDAGAPDLDFGDEWIEDPTSETPSAQEHRMPEEIEPERGISEHMLTGEDAVELESDEEVLQLDEAYEAEEGDLHHPSDSVDPECVDATDDPAAGSTADSAAGSTDIDDILAEVDAVPGIAPEEGQEEPPLIDLDDLEDDTLLSLDDLDDALDLAVEIEVEEEDTVSPEDVSIQIEEEVESTVIEDATLPEDFELDPEPMTLGFREPTEEPAVPDSIEDRTDNEAEITPDSLEGTPDGFELEIDAEPNSTLEPQVAATPEIPEAVEIAAEPEIGAEPENTEAAEVSAEPEITEEQEVAAEVEVASEPDLGINSTSDIAIDEDSQTETPEVLNTPEESLPVAAQQEIQPQPAEAVAPSAPVAVAPTGLSAEALEASSEMIKEGMIGIRLSILEVKEGLGILQDPVDSVSKNTEKVSDGVREIASEARETRRALEDLGARLENLDFSSLRSAATQSIATGGTLATGVGLALLVLTWCLGLYLRGEGNTMSLYIVFGANLLITFAILMLRTPRRVFDE